MSRLLAIATLLPILAGCAGSAYDIVRRHDNLRNYTGADAGFVVASEGGEREGRFDTSGITFRRVGTEELFDFYFATRQMFGTPEHDFGTGSVIGTVQPKRLPPGDYEAVEVVASQFNNGGQARRPIAPGRLRFHVTTGEAVYLGRFVIASSSSSLQVTISDSEADDLAIARKRVPELPAGAVTSAVPPETHRSL